MTKNDIIGSAIISKTRKEIVIFLDEGIICKIIISSMKKLMEGEKACAKVLNHVLNDQELENLQVTCQC